MADFFAQLALFGIKAVIILVIVLAIVFGIVVLLAQAKQKTSGRLSLKNLNQKLEDTKSALLAETLSKKAYKQYRKEKKKADSALEKSEDKKPAVYVLTFNGDIKASQVEALREEITAILSVAEPKDEVLLKVESGGGVVHGYGLAASELLRLKDANIKLTVSIDKVAASGGYLMACVADHIIAAPFSIIGSIGVIVQLPNFHRLLQDKHIDFEMETAGEYKRTLTVFGKNTDAGRLKLKEELEQIHSQFKQLIQDHRPQLNLSEVATGEHWLGQQALALKLVDTLETSDAYLLKKMQQSNVYELNYELKKPLLAKLTGATATVLTHVYDHLTQTHRRIH